MSLAAMRRLRAGPAGPTITLDPREHAPWALRVWRNHLTFRGRTGRRAFFVRVFVVLFTLLILGLSEAAARWTITGLAAQFAGVGVVDPALVAVQLVFLGLRLTGLWSLASLLVRRLHDVANTGWWALPAFAFMTILVLSTIYAGAATPGEALGLVTPALLAVVALFGARPGTDGPNRYGDRADPHEAPREAWPPPDVFT